jgi:hypothetical protein
VHADRAAVDDPVDACCSRTRHQLPDGRRVDRAKVLRRHTSLAVQRGDVVDDLHAV